MVVFSFHVFPQNSADNYFLELTHFTDVSKKSKLVFCSFNPGLSALR